MMPGQEVPQMPQQEAVGGAPEVTQDQRQALLALIQQIREKLGSFNAVSFAAGNKTEEMRRDLLKQIFEKLQMAGIDLTDRESVSSFIASLRESHPELAEMFEEAIGALLGGDEPVAEGPRDPAASMDLGVPPQNDINNMNKNEELSQGQRGSF